MPGELFFWLCILTVVYAYLGYPLVLLVLRAVLHRPVRQQSYEPTVTLIIPAYNEAAHIEAKIRDSLAQQYPEDKLEVLVACDGPRDKTIAIAQQMEDGRRVRVLPFPVNRGKIAVLNDAAREARGDILVFSDASAYLYPDALRHLMRNFADSDIGAVSGRYTVVKADEVSIGGSEDFYWRYETFLKVKESELASTLGAHGHLHAIRKHLYPFPPPGTINDDYIIPVSVLAKRFRAVYEPSAVVYEAAREMTGFGRRVRVMAGNIQQMREIRGLLSPFRPLPLFFFLSHKAVRLAVPFAMLGAVVANLFLLDRVMYQYTMALQVLFYLLAIAGTVVKLRPKLLMLPYYFTMINMAGFLGFYYALTNLRRMRWK